MIVLGLDLSLRSPGAVLLPSDWDLDWRRVTIRELPADKRAPQSHVERVDRVARIVDAVKLFGRGADACAIEQLAMGARSRSVTELSGLWWSTALALRPMLVVPVTPSAARSLLGKAPRKGGKDWAHARMTEAGCPTWWGPDTRDAFLVANYLLSDGAGTALVMRGA